MSIFSSKGMLWRSSPFTEPFTDEVIEVGPTPNRYTRLTYEDGEVSLYCVEDDIGPHPNIFQGFIEVGEGCFVSAKGVAKIETWRE